MQTEKQLTEVLERIQRDALGFIAGSLVDLESGMTLAAVSARPDFDLPAASAYNSELVKQKLKIVQTLGLSGSVEDILITLSDQIHLVKLISATTFAYVAVDRAQSNLAIVRTAVARHAKDLE